MANALAPIWPVGSAWKTLLPAMIVTAGTGTGATPSASERPERLHRIRA
jgi:hypothetical protein